MITNATLRVRAPLIWSDGATSGISRISALMRQTEGLPSCQTSPDFASSIQTGAIPDLDADPIDILRWFIRRWSIEVTFAEVRRHLGVETQRQWSDPAIARTTPALLGLFSLVTLWAHDLYARGTPAPRMAN